MFFRLLLQADVFSTTKDFQIVEERLQFEMLTMMGLNFLNLGQSIEILFCLMKYLTFVKTNQLILLEARKSLYEWLFFTKKCKHDLKNINYLQVYSATNKIILYLHAIY